MIEVKNVFKSFDGVPVLKDISTSFEKGKTNLVIGQSGSGKTVLLKSIVGLHEIDSGQIIYDGRSFTNMNFKERKAVRQEIGMVFQGGALFDSLSVEENVRFPLDMFTKKTAKEKLDRVNFCLDHVNMNASNKKFPSELSGGMKKRVSIARAIALNPKYLFCDEPNSGLDPKTSILIDSLLKELTEEFQTTTVINTHDMNSVKQIGANVVFIHKGELWWEGNNSEIFNTTNPELKDFISASGFMSF